MSKDLQQKTRFNSIAFSVDDTGLFLRKKNNTEDLELHFPFEQISTNKASILNHNLTYLIWGSLTGLFVLYALFLTSPDNAPSPNLVVFCAFVSAILFGMYFFTRSKKTYVYTSDNKHIEFYTDNPGIDEVNAFIETLFRERNNYLVSKYGNPNRNLEYAPQLENLNWLLNTKAFPKAVYDEKVKELNALFNNKGNGQIGFIAQK